MAGWWSDLTRAVPVSAFAIAGAVIILVAGVAIGRKFRRRIPDEELERRRRQLVHRNGKLGDGEIIDVNGTTILYSYYIAGVNYTTSQDIGSLNISLLADRMSVIGPVSIRFLPGNPANSIVVCEEWSGLRNSDRSPAKAI
jgi:hypothetical protein